VDIWELLARESIRDLVARYNANGDAGRFEQMLSVFADDATMEIVTHTGDVEQYQGLEPIASLFRGTKATWDGLPARPGSPHHVRHFVSSHQIDLLDRTHAGGRSYFLVLMPHGLDHWGRYIDEYEERDGRWVITRRRAVSDGRIVTGEDSPG